MDAKQILKNIQGDLASAPATRAIYVEGDTDPPILFGLLGVTPAVTGHYVHKHTLVKDLKGRDWVEQYVTTAAASAYADQVFGIIDGDGEEYAALQPRFDARNPGPLFSWEAYSIESHFPRCAWDPAWGAAPNWQADLAQYAPYVALSRTHVLLEAAQETLRLAKRTKPSIGTAPLTVAGEKARLAAAKHLITGFDAEAIFDQEVLRFQTALGNSVAEAMALLDGKWLFSHFMGNHCGGGSLAHWRTQWILRVTGTGGLAEVRDLWQRITGALP